MQYSYSSYTHDAAEDTEWDGADIHTHIVATATATATATLPRCLARASIERDIHIMQGNKSPSLLHQRVYYTVGYSYSETIWATWVCALNTVLAHTMPTARKRGQSSSSSSSSSLSSPILCIPLPPRRADSPSSFMSVSSSTHSSTQEGNTMCLYFGLQCEEKGQRRVHFPGGFRTT